MFFKRDNFGQFIFLSKSTVCLLLLALFLPERGTGQGTDKPDSSIVDELSSKADVAMLSNVDSGFFYAKKLLELGEQQEFDYARARGYEKLGWTHWVEGNYADGLKNALDAIRIFEQYGPSEGLVSAVLSAGRNLFEQRSYTMALTYYQRSEALAQELGLEKPLIEAYRDLGGISISLGEYEKGLDYCTRGLAITNRLGLRSSIPIFYSHIALIHFNQGDVEQSVDYNWRAILEGRLTGNRRIVALGFERLANIDLQQGLYDEAIRKGKETLEMGQELGSSLIAMRAYMVLSRGYEGKRDYEKSLTNYKLYIEISDSTYNADKESIIASIEAVYDLESKQGEIELLETEKALNEQESRAKNYYIILSLVAIGLLIALTFALFRASKFQNQHNSELQAKNGEIAAQAKKLEEMNATKSKIFSIIGHDLRNSVANLKQLLDLLNSKKITLKELREVAPEAKQSVDASFDVLDNLLHWGLTQMNGIRTNIEPVLLQPILAEITSHFKLFVERKNISLTFQSAANLMVLGDAPQLTVVLRNLVGNAIKFTKANGAIAVEAEDMGDLVRIRVKDNGVGISEDKLKLLFKHETHYSESGTNDEKGTGLGLLLCYEFVENMGSRLEVETALGEGTTFFFDMKKA
ncbi:ATP-binding protein [uncultured Imperialibacter sp.]|uniref:sensor histidine kinase n=1 Tax=uncultured Imperialibacter sp. TaxID=1672639 RepID=UPI0030D91335|tara:strand:- start:15634 stop:17544 length:1911 start_codon:yes stop_codon:yes gene_type:complete